MEDLIYKDECYQIIGRCFEVHNVLGHGFAEVIYKDALEIEFLDYDIYFEREKGYPVNYKNHRLKRMFNADFVVFEKIILEVKCVKAITDEHIATVINNLKVSSNKLALLVNFGRHKLEYRRIVF